MIIINEPIDGDILYKNLKNSERKYYEEKKNLIVNNVFLDKKYVAKFRSWIKHNNKITNIVKNFYYKLKINYTIKKSPENEVNLNFDTIEESNSKKVYIYDFQNKKKWWFDVKEINQLINSSLCCFDDEYLGFYSKTPINPYTKVVLSYKDLLSIYDQLKSLNSQSFLFELFKKSDFNIQHFIIKYTNSIQDHFSKVVLPTLDNNTLCDMFTNIACEELGLNYINYHQLYYYSELIRHDILSTVQYCYFVINQELSQKITKIKSFINKYRFLIKRANHISNNILPTIQNSPSTMSVDSDDEVCPVCGCCVNEESEIEDEDNEIEQESDNEEECSEQNNTNNSQESFSNQNNNNTLNNEDSNNLEDNTDYDNFDLKDNDLDNNDSNDESDLEDNRNDSQDKSDSDDESDLEDSASKNESDSEENRNDLDDKSDLDENNDFEYIENFNVSELNVMNLD